MSEEREYTIGVDPGLVGACVGLVNGEPNIDLLVRAKKYAAKTTSFAKNRLDINALYDDLQNLRCVRGAVAYIEQPLLSFGGKGAATSASQFETYGKFLAVLTLLEVKEIIEVRPTDWKKKYGLIKPVGVTVKRASCNRVRELFPKIDLMVKDADIAEAILIGRYGYRYMRGER